MEHHYKAASFIAKLLDNQFKILNFKFGLDPLLGLIPGVGDIITILFSFYLIWIAHGMKLPQEKINQMIRNVIFDSILGFIPILGDLMDFVYKANSKNLEILRQYKNQMIEGEII